MVRNLVVGVGVAVMLVSCGTDSGQSDTTTTATITTTVVSTTTSVASSSTTVAFSSTTLVPETTTTALSYELGVWAAPADGQWFNELPIPWVYSVEPPDTGPPPQPVRGSSGWTRQEADVTVNGYPTDSETCRNCMYQRGQLWQWRAEAGSGDPFGFEPGTHSVVFTATFDGGVVVEEARTFHYDPSLEGFTGWMVDLDPDKGSITFAASMYESAEEDGADTGPVTSVVAYPVRDDATFILLDVDSGGQPPSSTLGFEEFADLVARAHAGDCDRCFYGSDSDFFAEPDAERGAEYFVIYLRDSEIQQLEQIWRP